MANNELNHLYRALANSEAERLRYKNEYAQLRRLATKLAKALHTIGVQCAVAAPECPLPNSLADHSDDDLFKELLAEKKL